MKDYRRNPKSGESHLPVEERGSASGALLQAPELESFERRHIGSCGSIVDLHCCNITLAGAAASSTSP